MVKDLLVSSYHTQLLKNERKKKSWIQSIYSSMPFTHEVYILFIFRSKVMCWTQKNRSYTILLLFNESTEISSRGLTHYINNKTLSTIIILFGIRLGKSITLVYPTPFLIPRGCCAYFHRLFHFPAIFSFYTLDVCIFSSASYFLLFGDFPIVPSHFLCQFFFLLAFENQRGRKWLWSFCLTLF